MSEESTTKRSFIRDNILIVASVALPVIIVILFAAASGIPRLFTPEPAHDLVLVARNPGTSPQLPVMLDVIVSEGRATVLVRKRDRPMTVNMPRIYLYQSATDDVTELPFELPTDWDAVEDGAQLPITGLEGANLSTAVRAPDGYEYRGVRRGGNGLMFDLFGGRRYTGDVTIARNGAIRVISLPDHTQYWYGNPQFVAWVVNWE